MRKPKKKWKDMTLKEKVKSVASDVAVTLGAAYFVSTVMFNAILPHAWANTTAKKLTSKEVSEFGGFGDIDFARYSGKDASGKDSSLERKTLDWLKYATILTERNLDYGLKYGVSIEEMIVRCFSQQCFFSGSVRSPAMGTIRRIMCTERKR